jgi:8-oxo-dGTP pyrophosphatase MutT (NUDIX family)
MTNTHGAAQVAALPIDIGKNGQVYVLLVTSRETKRWVIPKGWPCRKLSDPKAAEREAREEAGVTGKIDRKPVGSYSYRKVLPEGTRLIEVAVYPLWVKKEHKHWSEQRERRRIWATLEEAAKLVREAGLQRLFLLLAEEIGALTGDKAVEKIGEIAE